MTENKKSTIPEALSDDDVERISGGLNFGTANADSIADEIGKVYVGVVRIDNPK